MKRKRDLKLSNHCRLQDGSLRFLVKLPPEVADRFLKECALQDRKKQPMVTFMVREYLRQKALGKDLEELRQLQALREARGPHFEEKPSLPRPSILRKALR